MTGRWSETLRWGGCFALVLCLHIGGAAALLARWSEDTDLVANAPVIMVDLAPEAVAPDVTPTEVPPDTVLSRQAEPEPEPERPLEKLELPSAPQADLQVTPPPKPVEKPKEKKPKQKQASVNSAPSATDRKSGRAAAPSAGANSRNPEALRNWQSELAARLERHKRYPAEARGASGTALLAFSVDHGGGVHNARIVRSSGSSVLDSETLSLVQRAQPLPPPPPDQSGLVNVPIRYNMR
jgi:protein TonB